MTTYTILYFALNHLSIIQHLKNVFRILLSAQETLSRLIWIPFRCSRQMRFCFHRARRLRDWLDSYAQGSSGGRDLFERPTISYSYRSKQLGARWIRKQIHSSSQHDYGLWACSCIFAIPNPRSWLYCPLNRKRWTDHKYAKRQTRFLEYDRRSRPHKLLSPGSKCERYDHH